MSFYSVMERLTFQARRGRQLERYREEKALLERCSDDELLFEYAEKAVDYAHQKRLFSVMLLAALLAALCGGRLLRRFAGGIARLGGRSETELAVFLEAAVAVYLLLFAVALVVLLSYLREIRETHRRLLLIEAVKSGRAKG